MRKQFLVAKDICEICGVSSSKAYAIMREMNDELRKRGFMVIAGKVPTAFFNDKFYGGIAADPDEDNK